MKIGENLPDILSPEALARIRSTLLPDADFSAPVCEMAAAIYLHGQASVDNGTGRGLKADIRAMHREVLTSLNALTQARLEVIAVLGLCGGERAVPRFTELKSELAWLENALALAIRLPKRRFSKSHPWYLLCAISILVAAFERATGTRATHSLHRDGQYVGEPLSPFGRFTICLFAEVDPLLSKRTIGSAIRKVFSNYRRDSHLFVVPDDPIRITAH